MIGVAGERRVAWRSVFGDDRPVEVEIGPGRGEMLLAAAAAAPETNFLAIERAPGAGETIADTVARRALANVRVLAADARCVIGRLVPDASVAAYRIFFPDPWPKTRHRERRLMNATFAGDLARTLVPGGTVHLASDLRRVLEEYSMHLIGAGLVPVPGAEPPRGRPTTAFERKYATAGTLYARFTRPR